MASAQALLDFIKANGGKVNVSIFDGRLRSTNLPEGVTLRTITNAVAKGQITKRRVTGTNTYDLAEASF